MQETQASKPMKCAHKTRGKLPNCLVHCTTTGMTQYGLYSIGEWVRGEKAIDLKDLHLAFGPSPGRNRSTARITRSRPMEEARPIGTMANVRKCLEQGEIPALFLSLALHVDVQSAAEVAALEFFSDHPTRETNVARFFTFGAFALLVVASAAIPSYAANATVNYPWCAHYMMQNGPKSCGFVTLAQCQATVSGIGGFCDMNPFYVPAKPPAARPRRSRQT